MNGCFVAIPHQARRAKNGFALIRPSGRYARVHQSMGFCLHNNIVVAALVAQVAGAKKVLIVDWVHLLSLYWLCYMWRSYDNGLCFCFCLGCMYTMEMALKRYLT